MSKYETVGDVLVLSLQGKLNSANSADIEADILRNTGQTNRLLLDLSGLDYISSAGLRVVLVVAKRLKQSAGLLVLCGIQNQVKEVFEISGFLDILDVVDTRDQAMRKFPRE